MFRTLLSSCVGVALITSLAAPAAAEDPEIKLTPSGLPMRGEGRVVVDMPRSMFTPAEPKISPYIYLNRCTGGCIVHGGTTNDARTNTSAIPNPGDYTLSEYKDAMMHTGALADPEWNAVVQCMKEVYSPFNVTVTDQKPVGVSYTMAFIAGVPSEVGLGNDILGIAPLANDCSPQDNVISFSFANYHGAQARVNNICWTAAQETAHALGLDHEYVFSDGTSACSDPMTYRMDCGGEKFFRNKPAQCGEYGVKTCRCGGSQNSHVKIRGVFGDGVSLIAAPTCDLVTPTAGTIAQGGVVTGSSGSKRGVAKVELYINGFKWTEKPGAAFLGNGQPNPSMYQLMLPNNVPDGTLDIQLKCYDDLNLVTESSLVTVTKGSCSSAETCKCLAGQKFEDGKCFWTAPTGELGADCSYNQFCKTGICAMTDTGGYCSQECIVGSTDTCPMSFECIATSATAGECLPTDTGGCCSVSSDRNAVWLHIGLGGLVLGLVVRRRRKK